MFSSAVVFSLLSDLSESESLQHKFSRFVMHVLSISSVEDEPSEPIELFL